MMNHALVNPNILAWSRSRAGLSASSLATSLPVKLDKVLAWEAGESRPTFRQAQQWASLAHIPFGYLFLNAPPQEPLPLPDLRTVGSVAVAPPSIDLQDTLREVMRKQAWYVDYLKQQEQAPLPFIGRFSVNSDVASVVADMRAVLRLPESAPRQGSDHVFAN
jgi:transcriptional regulator with XRE-family HTH domain